MTYIDDDFSDAFVGMESALTAADLLREAMAYLKNQKVTPEVRAFMYSIGMGEVSPTLKRGGDDVAAITAELETAMEGLADAIGRGMVKAVDEMLEFGMRLVNRNHEAMRVLETEGIESFKKKYPDILKIISENPELNRLYGRQHADEVLASSTRSIMKGLEASRTAISTLRTDLPNLIGSMHDGLQRYNRALAAGDGLGAKMILTETNTVFTNMVNRISGVIEGVAINVRWEERIPIPIATFSNGRLNAVVCNIFPLEHMQQAYSNLLEHSVQAQVSQNAWGAKTGLGFPFYDNVTDVFRNVVTGEEVAVPLVKREMVMEMSKHARMPLIKTRRVDAPAPPSPDKIRDELQNRINIQDTVTTLLKRANAETVNSVSVGVKTMQEKHSLPVRLIISIYTAIGRFIRWVFHALTFGAFRATK